MRWKVGGCRSSRQSGFVEEDGGTTSRRLYDVLSGTITSPDHKLETASMSYSCARRSPVRPRRFDEAENLCSRIADTDARRCRPQSSGSDIRRTAQKAQVETDK